MPLISIFHLYLVVHIFTDLQKSCDVCERNLKQAAIADDMKAILIQSHEFGLKKKLDFYWISPNLIIDRKSQQRMMHFVCFNGDLKKAEILLDRGAKLNVRDVHGNTPLMMSIQGPKMFHPHELVKVRPTFDRLFFAISSIC